MFLQNKDFSEKPGNENKVLDNIHLNESPQTQNNSVMNNLITNPDDLNRVVNYLQQYNSQEGIDQNSFFLDSNSFHPTSHHIHFNTPQWSAIPQHIGQNEQDLMLSLPNATLTPYDFSNDLTQRAQTPFSLFGPHYNHSSFQNGISGFFTPPINPMTNAQAFSSLENASSTKFWSLPNSGNLNMLTVEDLNQDLGLLCDPESNTFQNKFSENEYLPTTDGNNVMLTNQCEAIQSDKSSFAASSKKGSKDGSNKKPRYTKSSLRIENTSKAPFTDKQSLSNPNLSRDSGAPTSAAKNAFKGNESFVFIDQSCKSDKPSKSIFTPLNIMNSGYNKGTGLNVGTFSEPFVANPIPLSKLNVKLPPKLQKAYNAEHSDDDNLKFGSVSPILTEAKLYIDLFEKSDKVTDEPRNNNFSLNLPVSASEKEFTSNSSQLNSRAESFRPHQSLQELNSNNICLSYPKVDGVPIPPRRGRPAPNKSIIPRNLISPAIRPAGITTEISTSQLISKSNYQNIAEGNSAALGLNYAPGFEQIVKRKRLHHQASEQKRRAILAQKFKELGSILTDLDLTPHGPSQTSILTRAYQTINDQKKLYTAKALLLSKLKKRFSVSEDSEDYSPLPSSIPLANILPLLEEKSNSPDAFILGGETGF